MKTRTCGVAVVFLLLLSSNSEGRKDYILENFRYYKPTIADIRTSTNMMRLYRSDPVDFTVSKDAEAEDHLFWDVSFGGVIPLVGYNFTYDPDSGPARNPMEITGIMMFVDASANMLLDFDAESAAIINTDYRVGLGLATRLPGSMKNIGLRYRFFHESAHIGDEYSLFGSQEYGDSFLRYNVSYEAHDVFASIDRYTPWGDPLLPLRIAYLRTYGGYRWFTEGFDFAARRGIFQELNDRTAPLRSSDYETQVGGEVYFRAFREQTGPLFIRRLKFQYLFVAADFYYRDLYAIDTPEKKWSTNVMAGIVSGHFFEGERDFRLFVNYYDGVQPHGQFRKDILSYLGIGIASDF